MKMNKIHNILFSSVAASLLLTGCADNFDTSYDVNKPESVALDELTRPYDVLKSYAANMKLGANLSLSDLNTVGTAYTTVLANFNEVNLTDAFSHASNVADDGTINVSSAEDAVQKVIDNGLSLYGGVLFSPTSYNKVVVAEATKDTWVEGTSAENHQVFDFEDEEIGKTFGTDKYSKVADDPTGTKGKSLFNKQKAKFIEFPVTLPDGCNLSNLNTLTFDYYSSNVKKEVLVRVKVGDTTKEIKKLDTPTAAKTWETLSVDFSKVNLTELFTTDELQSNDITIVIGQGANPQQVYVDNIDVYTSYNNPGYYVPRADEEKAADVKKTLYAYADSVINHYGTQINTWTVAANLLDDLFGDLKSSEGSAEDGEFYPNDYLGENYVVDLCKHIHEKNPDVKLFYSESGGLLNGDGTKLDAMVNIVKQWNEAGAKIEGIDVKVDLPYNTASLADTKAAYDDLLGKLKETGLQIRLSDMNVFLADAGGTALNLSSVTAEEMKGMADLYTYMVSKYQELIPENQRYGLSFSSLNENGINVGLWKNYNRRLTYIGVANGLQNKQTEW